MKNKKQKLSLLPKDTRKALLIIKSVYNTYSGLDDNHPEKKAIREQMKRYERKGN